MRMLKILFLCLVLTVVAVGAGAESVVEAKPFTVEEMENFDYSGLPKGLSYTIQNISEGHAELVVDSAKTNWDWVSGYSELIGVVEATVNMPMIEGAAYARGEAFLDNTNQYADLMDEMEGVLNDRGDKLMPYAPGGWVQMADVSFETSTVKPSVYDATEFMFFGGFYYNENQELIAKKYATLYISYTNSGAQSIQMPNVPKERMNPSVNGAFGNVKCMDGLVEYELDETFNGTKVQFDVASYPGADRCEIKGAGNGAGNSTTVVVEGLKSTIIGAVCTRLLGMPETA